MTGLLINLLDGTLLERLGLIGLPAPNLAVEDAFRGLGLLLLKAMDACGGTSRNLDLVVVGVLIASARTPPVSILADATALLAVPIPVEVGELINDPDSRLAVPLVRPVDGTLFLLGGRLLRRDAARAGSVFDRDLAASNIFAAAAGQHVALVLAARTPLVMHECLLVDWPR
jgi:hypothetical protein